MELIREVRLHDEAARKKVRLPLEVVACFDRCMKEECAALGLTVEAPGA